jgi:flavin reductase (DIM6/NTAB) family NADH-FMN oxidoreductase RutF
MSICYPSGGDQMKKSIGAKTIIFPTPVFLIGSYDPDGKPNLATVSWGGICNSDPPSLTISLRKATYTHGNIVRNGVYTVSIPNVEQVRAADLVGMISGRDHNKFEVAGLTPIRGTQVNAPYVEECPLVVECKVIHTFELGLHTQFIGQILDVKADLAVLSPDGLPDTGLARPFAYCPGTVQYYAMGEMIGKAFQIGRQE